MYIMCNQQTHKILKVLKMKKLICLVVFVFVVIHGVSNAGAKTINTYNLKQAEIAAGV